MPTATEEQIAWKIVEEVSINRAELLLPVFKQHLGVNGRLSIQTDPRFFRDSKAILAQAVRFNALAPNMIVKIPATQAGISAIEEATYLGISINATVCFTLPQCVAVAEAVERGFKRRESEGKAISDMGPVCTIMVGRLDDWLKVQTELGMITTDPGNLEWAGAAVFPPLDGASACTGAALSAPLNALLFDDDNIPVSWKLRKYINPRAGQRPANFQPVQFSSLAYSQNFARIMRREETPSTHLQAASFQIASLPVDPRANGVRIGLLAQQLHPKPVIFLRGPVSQQDRSAIIYRDKHVQCSVVVKIADR
jgi:hypothetical protein